jgi:hypothetical protein
MAGERRLKVESSKLKGYGQAGRRFWKCAAWGFGIFQLLTFNSPPVVHAAVVINEVAFDEPTGSPDWVELYNNGSSAVSVDGWTMDDVDALTPVTLNLGTPVPAGAFVVVFIDTTGVNETDFSDNVATVYSGTATTVNLAATEDDLALYNSATQNSTTIVDFLSWQTDGLYGDSSTSSGDQVDPVGAGIWSSGTAVSANDSGSGYSVGRVSDGADANTTDDWQKFGTPTRGSANNSTGGGVTPEVCTNSADDDGDGDADCADSDCASHVSCQTTSVVNPTSEVLAVEDAFNPFSPYDALPSMRQGVVYFRVGSGAVVKTIRVANVRGETVRVLLNNDLGPAGSSVAGVASGSVQWDGRDDGGEFVPTGIYIVFLEGVDPATGDRVVGRDTIVVGRPF